MNEKHITRRSLADRKRGRTDFERLKNLTDKEIEAAIASDPDAAPAINDFAGWEIAIPARKKAVSIRLDEDILDFFKETGSRYQTRINEVLRHYMTSQKAKKKA